MKFKWNSGGGRERAETADGGRRKSEKVRARSVNYREAYTSNYADCMADTTASPPPFRDGLAVSGGVRCAPCSRPLNEKQFGGTNGAHSARDVVLAMISFAPPLALALCRPHTFITLCTAHTITDGRLNEYERECRTFSANRRCGCLFLFLFFSISIFLLLRRISLRLFSSPFLLFVLFSAFAEPFYCGSL